MGRLTDKIELILVEEQLDVEQLMDKYLGADEVPGVCLLLNCDAVGKVKPETFENKCPSCGNYTLVAYNIIIDN